MGTAAIGGDVLRTEESFAKADKWDELCEEKLERDRHKTEMKAEAEERFVEQVKSGRLQFLVEEPPNIKQVTKLTMETARNSTENVVKSLELQKERLLKHNDSRHLVREFSNPVLTMTKASSNIYDISASSLNESDIIEDGKSPGPTDGQHVFTKLRLVDYIVKE